MTALLSLRLSDNRLSGELRPTYSMLTNLRHLDLSKNKVFRVDSLAVVVFSGGV
jgi:hypothetical protein